MEKNDFNPNAAAVANGNYFGMPYTVDEASVVLISVPWDVTTSYRPGTSKGPEAIIAASPQLDFFDFDVEDAWKIGIGTLPIDTEVKFLNEAMRPLAEKVISHLENGGDQSAISADLATVNAASLLLNQKIFQSAKQLLQKGKLIGLIGGEHSVPLGFMHALAELNPGFGILHIDAHADLRQAYEGFTYSHASIMYNALKLEGISKLIQVAVRDECEDEVKLISSDDRIVQFDDYLLAAAAFEGKTWKELCTEIVRYLPQNVYVSFDIDGLSPELCPNTGTPVPGGLSFQKAVYLLRQLVESGRTIIGFDVTEVAPGEDEWDANVGARIIYKLCNLMYLSNAER
ncbi:MAG: agmatinase family protein [Bacteroidetes bacterium]|nr:agmatinase family protein [Bacteroidota bacterium]